MNHPDGMASMVTEREHMREMRNLDEPTHDIVAVDSDGNVLWDTEACWSEAEAEKALPSYNDGLYAEEIGQEVDHFEIRER